MVKAQLYRQALKTNLYLSQLVLEAHLAKLLGVEEGAELRDNWRSYGDSVLKTFWVDGSLVRRVGRSALRPGRVSRACRVDRPPALFSQAEENLRPLEPVFASSTGEGSGSGSRNQSLTPGGCHGQA